MKVVDLLTNLGVPITAAQTYAALLEMDSVSIRKVAAKTGINRGTTYEALKDLVNQGLVSTKTNGKREYYTAESPEKIYDIIRDKRKDLMDSNEQAKKIVPELLAQKIQPQGRPIVKYYEDDDGVVAILTDVLQTCRVLESKQYYAYSSKPIRQYLYRNFPQFTERRISEGITVKVIAVGDGGEVTTSSERKWIDEPKNGGISSYTLIYGNKVAQISISADFTPYGVVIEDEGATALQRLLFEHLWEQL